MADTAGDDGHGTVIRVVGTGPDDVEVGFWPLDGEHPLVVLMGFTAPSDWLAIGVRCTGRAYSLDPPPQPRPVAITTLVDRTGRGAGLMRPLLAAGDDGAGDAAGRPPVRSGGGQDHEGCDETGAFDAERRFATPAEGMIGDACRRALGLPTPPPPASTAEMWLRVWLDRLVEATAFRADDRPELGWDDLVALHPAATLHQAVAPVRVRHPGVARPGLLGPHPGAEPHALAEATLALAERWTWDELRRDPEVLAATGPPIPRDLAAWMDDGMFARVVLAELAPLPVVMRSARLLLPQPQLDDLDEVVLAVGLPHRAPPDRHAAHGHGPGRRPEPAASTPPTLAPPGWA